MLLTDDPVDNLRTAIMPALALASRFAVYTRLLRADMITTLQQDSITWPGPRASPPGILSATPCAPARSP